MSINLLFVCRENACRSQMAEAFARAYGREAVQAWSAGSQPRGSVDETAKSVMAERGIDLETHRSKGLEHLPPLLWDVVVSMGCGDHCPSVRARQQLEWQIPDPARQPVEIYRQVRDEIERHVKELLSCAR